MAAAECPSVRILQRAAETLGDAQRLAAELSVPLAALQSWMNGDKATPFEVFSKALDIVARGPLR
jgi:hypothetical protein